jgi:hypothetical protein
MGQAGQHFQPERENRANLCNFVQNSNDLGHKPPVHAGTATLPQQDG